MKAARGQKHLSEAKKHKGVDWKVAQRCQKPISGSNLDLSYDLWQESYQGQRPSKLRSLYTRIYEKISLILEPRPISSISI